MTTNGDTENSLISSNATVSVFCNAGNQVYTFRETGTITLERASGSVLSVFGGYFIG